MKKRKQIAGIMDKTGTAVYKMPDGKLVVSKKRAELRYDPTGYAIIWQRPTPTPPATPKKLLG